MLLYIVMGIKSKAEIHKLNKGKDFYHRPGNSVKIV